MRARWQSCAALLVVAPAAQAQSPPTQLAAVSRADFCVTEGALEEHDRSLLVTVPKMRAYVNRAASDVAQLTFSYLGPTAVESSLGSGASRRQFGIKLRAADACNLIYVMWRVTPESKLVVSVKANPGQQSSAQCANRGYRNLKPVSSATLPALEAGAAHQLQARIRGDDLRVHVDGRLVWQGSVGPVAAAFAGPVGMRTDNTRLEFTFATQASPAGLTPVPPCRAGAQASD